MFSEGRRETDLYTFKIRTFPLFPWYEDLVGILKIFQSKKKKSSIL